MKMPMKADADIRVNRGELFVATLTISMLSLALPLLTLQVYDRILPNPGSGTFPVLIGGLCVAVVLEMVIRLARARMIGSAGISCGWGNRSSIYSLMMFGS